MAEREDETSGDSTDAFSDKFNSMKALYTDRAPVPVPEAPIYDNLGKFESVVLKGHANKPSRNDTQRKKEGETSSQRLFSHQEPTAAFNREHQSKYSEKNVLSRMQKMFGPLAVLYNYMENKTRIKVYTRNETGIRGHVEAYIAAFDRHWNLALEDCLETWSRKVKRKAPALGCSIRVADPNSDGNHKIIVKERNRKTETLERHVPQLLLRGEQVAFIVKID